MKELRHRALIISVLVGSVGVAPAPAVEHIFSDGFEWGPTCGGTALWFPDLDGDRWGDRNASGTTVGCPAPAGLVPNNGDCDDGNAMINPNAFEVPANALDDNCDAQTDETPGIWRQRCQAIRHRHGPVPDDGGERPRLGPDPGRLDPDLRRGDTRDAIPGDPFVIRLRERS